MMKTENTAVVMAEVVVKIWRILSLFAKGIAKRVYCIDE